MKYRAGNYTIFNGRVCKLFEQRHEMPFPKFEIQYDICYDTDDEFNCEGFTKHPFEDMYCKLFKYNEINNAFFAQTYGLFNEMKVKVFKNTRELSLVNIITREKEAKFISAFLDMGDYFMMETSVDNLKKIWEERTVSKFDFQFPDGLEKFVVMKE
jgi:hypothetical protein